MPTPGYYDPCLQSDRKAAANPNPSMWVCLTLVGCPLVVLGTACAVVCWYALIDVGVDALCGAIGLCPPLDRDLPPWSRGRGRQSGGAGGNGGRGREGVPIGTGTAHAAPSKFQVTDFSPRSMHGPRRRIRLTFQDLARSLSLCVMRDWRSSVPAPENRWIPRCSAKADKNISTNANEEPSRQSILSSINMQRNLSPYKRMLTSTTSGMSIFSRGSLSATVAEILKSDAP